MCDACWWLVSIVLPIYLPGNPSSCPPYYPQAQHKNWSSTLPSTHFCCNSCYSVCICKPNLRRSSRIINLYYDAVLGVYSVVYFGTVYLYCEPFSSCETIDRVKSWLSLIATRGLSRHRMVIGAISVSYFFSVLQTNLQWWVIKRSFIDSGATQDAILVTMRPNPSWYNLVTKICYFIVGVIADGLLVRKSWPFTRPYSFYSEYLLLRYGDASTFGIVHSEPSYYHLFSYSAQLVCAKSSYNYFILKWVLPKAVYFSMLVVMCVDDLNSPTSHGAQIKNTLIGVALFLDLTSTLATTGLISYRINPFAKQGTFNRSRFKHIVEILVQSAAAYSLVTIAYALVLLIPTELESVNAARAYTSVFYSFAAVCCLFHWLFESWTLTKIN